jgi:hypothetical protein
MILAVGIVAWVTTILNTLADGLVWVAELVALLVVQPRR